MPIELKKVNNKDKQRIQRRQVISFNMLPLPIWTQILWSPHNGWQTWTINGSLLLVWRTESTESAWCDIKPPGQTEAVFLIQQHSQDEEGQISTPASFLNRLCWNDLFPSEAIFRAVLQNSLHNYVPKDEERPNEKCDTRRNKLGMKQKGRWRRTEWRDGCHLASPTWKFIHCDSISQKPWWHENSLALVEKLTTREREE